MKITIFTSPRFKRMMAKLLSFLKYTTLFIIFILIFSAVGWDLDRNDGGYLRPIFYWIFDYFVSAGSEITDICATPFVSLSIAKISRLIWHLWVALSIFYFLRAVWLMIKDLLETHREKQEEQREINKDS